MMPIQNHLPIEPRDDVADLVEELERLDGHIRGMRLHPTYCREVADKLDRMRQTLNAAMSIPPEML